MEDADEESNGASTSDEGLSEEESGDDTDSGNSNSDDESNDGLFGADSFFN